MKTNLLMSLSGCVASSVGVLFAGMEAQQQPGSAPGGTPSQQPQPSNPTPRPTNPNQPNPNQPGQTQPGQSQPGQTQPGQNQPGQNQPGNPTPLERNPDRTPLNRQPGSSSDNPRFISLADPALEPRFRESATRLANLERSMAERNQRLVQRLGAARQLPADRQGAAVMDLLQDILQENAQLQQYLSQSRTLMTGDLGDPNDASRNPNAQPGTNQPANAQPGTNQPNTGQPGSNQPAPSQPAPSQPNPVPAQPRPNSPR